MSPECEPRARIVGIDWATKPTKVGLAFATVGDENCQLENVERRTKRPEVLQLIKQELDNYSPVLLAIDAPLGWPTKLRDRLPSHQAGEELRAGQSRLGELSVEEIKDDASLLFNRETDRDRETAGTRPLEIGANFIARTAHSALRLLTELRGRDAQSLPLGWDPGFPARSQVIEVYPAATMNAYKISKYKKDNGKTLAFLEEKLGKRVAQLDNELKNEHVLDAVICVLAGFDFIQKKVSMPKKWGDAKREGFIWVRRAEP